MNFKMITEFDFIKKYLISGEKNSKNSLNFTDDVGLVDNKIYSTDTICENIHFFSKDRPYHIAQKLIRVNVSDIVSKLNQNIVYSIFRLVKISIKNG